MKNPSVQQLRLSVNLAVAVLEAQNEALGEHVVGEAARLASDRVIDRTITGRVSSPFGITVASPGRLRGLAKSSARPFACRDELVAGNVWIVREVAFDGYLTCTTGAQKLSTESEILAVSRWSFSGFDGKLRWREELVSIRSGDDAPAFRSGSRIA